MSEGKPSNFESLSHFQLYEIVKDANPYQLSDASSALTAAFTDLDGIADEMLAHADNVKWKGEGSEAFRTWVEEISKQTRKLADYTELVGKRMGQAGTDLALVKSAMPKPDSPGAKLLPMCYVDEEKEKARLENDSARRQALEQIEKLDSSYTVAHELITKLEGQEPNFPLLPNFTPDDGYETPFGVSPSGSAAGNGPSGIHATPLAASDRTAVGPKAAPVHSVDEVSPHTPVTPPKVGGVISGVNVPDPTNTAIDSVQTPPAPDTINRPSTLPPMRDVPNIPSGGPPMPPITGLPGPRLVNPTAPPISRTTPVPGPGQLGKLPPTAPTTPRPSSMPPRIPTNDGIVGGKRNVGPTNAPRIPRGMVVGEEPHAPMARGPIGPGGYMHHGPTPTGPNAPGRRLVTEPGGMVDRPKGTNPPGRSLPRSMVVGEERGVLPRGPLGAGVHPVDGSAHAPGGTSSGRRLTSEPGGVTGGPRVPREGRSEFTQGGSGLVRGNHGPAAAPHSSALPPENRRNAGARPDYLEEDEDTWTGGRRNTVPPVIE
ncbi:hypothetical protein ACFV1F_35950 [Streptomyces sp. NPDC059590]|uniref:WXG100 family type VII secretion target n=1 Tax=Streptomyces sp. NPDC059590 TaxID=3346877 RepID=UPI00369EBB9C